MRKNPSAMATDEGFETVVMQIRRWILALGLFVLLLLVACGAARARLLGWCVGWLLSLFSLDQITSNARRLIQDPKEPGDAQKAAVQTIMRRWIVTIAVLLVSAKLGADPLAGVLALLLLQAAVMCRSIMSLLKGPVPSPPGEDPPMNETLG